MKILKFFLTTIVLSTASLANAAINVFTCEPEWAALAREIGADRVRVSTAISADQDPHQVQARPSLISAVRQADLVFCTGAELEVGWLPVLLARSANPRVQSAPGLLYAADQVSLIEQSSSTDRAHGDVHAAGNPHMHLDPHRITMVAKALTERLATLDPQGKAYYHQHLVDFLQRWQAAIEKWESRASHLKDTEVVVHHRSFSYLLNWLGMRAVAEMEPKPGLPPTPKHLGEILSKVEKENIGLILFTSFNGSQGANWLAKRSGACAVQLPFSNEKSLFSLYDELIEILVSKQGECL
ncbi:metal ABC transporter solute-binding protein, Zn/Mn family [Alcanivorax sp. 1008]|uniref:metal ABC transporter substrate-binding protein n=1 Tax=Alcanivorax sp. 1008 TaxID=2816853 RepID=UPI001DFA3B7A|nr:zinc ABC transporter substrate-binding protein [Alcanivorax sp. 1008]MCC1497032.1 zinc ABC transporter substrate-binding protein [Alcanivorax sp. 1008]